MTHRPMESIQQQLKANYMNPEKNSTPPAPLHKEGLSTTTEITTSHEEMLKLFRSALTKISRIAPKLENISIDLRIGFGSRRHDDDDWDFHIVIFSNTGSNRTVYFFQHDSIERLNRNLAAAIDLIKLDDFEAVKEALS